jgi:hypothetical protein
MLLYQVPHAVSPTPADCPTSGRNDWRLVTGWAPGTNAVELPEAAGFPEEDGVTHFALEIHYSNPKLTAGLTDKTEYQLCTTDQLRKYDAAVMRTGTENFVLPPHSDTTYTCEFQMPADMDGIHVISATPHMHNWGRELFVVAPGGSVLSQPSFDDANQYASPANIGVNPSEKLYTVCRWNNTSDHSVVFGERTGIDEMCYSYLTYYPAITAKGWDWQNAVQQAGCWVSTPPNK